MCTQEARTHGLVLSILFCPGYYPSQRAFVLRRLEEIERVKKDSRIAAIQGNTRAERYGAK